MFLPHNSEVSRTRPSASSMLNFGVAMFATTWESRTLASAATRLFSVPDALVRLSRRATHWFERENAADFLARQATIVGCGFDRS